jgi:hypothetical protein
MLCTFSISLRLPVQLPLAQSHHTLTLLSPLSGPRLRWEPIASVLRPAPKSHTAPSYSHLPPLECLER